MVIFCDEKKKTYLLRLFPDVNFLLFGEGTFVSDESQ